MISIDNDNANVYTNRHGKKINLLTPTATGNWYNKDSHHPRNGSDGKKDTYFALKGGV